MLDKSGVVPVEQYDLSRLRTMFLTGSPVAPEMCAWVYKNVGRDIWLAVQSGGTEVGTAIVGSVPTLPVYAGEMQARALGVDAHAWNDDGHEMINEIGELVLTSPMPSMPLYFWNDQNGERYKEAYFSKYPGVWVHGDRLRINERGGCCIYGRSDAVLNRNGVRIGSAEIYRTLEQLAEIADSMVVCIEGRNDKYYMPLFVQLRDGKVWTDKLKSKIVSSLRVECGPRHVPDDIFSVESIPYTLTGKKMEVPVRKILMGLPVDEAARRDAMRNPESLDWFVNFERQVLNKGRLDS
jgi:acetoacetyl-CoA synthetase